METLNTMRNAAVTAVWGDSKEGGQEPIAGQQGDTSKGEPYDKGNEDLSKPTSDSTSHAAFAKSSGTAAESKDVPDNPSTDLKAKDTPADSTKGQNDVRDPSDPKTNPKNAPNDVDDTGDGINEAQNLDGPGPKPLEEVAKTHGGDAAGANSSTSVDKDAGKKSDEEDESGINAPSKGEGTGEKYVKSTGLVADGGDFDATKPGAGREADRLLEEKGIHVAKPGDKPAPDLGSASSDKEKKSLKDKIKDKLHRH